MDESCFLRVDASQQQARVASMPEVDEISVVPVYADVLLRIVSCQLGDGERRKYGARHVNYRCLPRKQSGKLGGTLTMKRRKARWITKHACSCTNSWFIVALNAAVLSSSSFSNSAQVKAGCRIGWNHHMRVSFDLQLIFLRMLQALQAVQETLTKPLGSALRNNNTPVPESDDDESWKNRKGR